jgi:hypothetical protein
MPPRRSLTLAKSINLVAVGRDFLTQWGDALTTGGVNHDTGNLSASGFFSMHFSTPSGSSINRNTLRGAYSVPKL